MEAIQLQDMHKLLPPIEQAKLIGMLKEPERMQQQEKQKYILYGIGICCLLFAGSVIALHYIDNKNQQPKKESLT